MKRSERSIEQGPRGGEKREVLQQVARREKTSDLKGKEVWFLGKKGGELSGRRKKEKWWKGRIQDGSIVTNSKRIKEERTGMN